MNLFKKLLDIVFPYSDEEKSVIALDGAFPVHLSTHSINNPKIKQDIITSALSDYNDFRVKALIHTLKYKGFRASVMCISEALGEYLLEVTAHHLSMYPAAKIVIIPIPLAKQREKKRGFNQITILLDKIKQSQPELSQYIDTKLLHKTRETQSQTHLSRKMRMSNIQNAFEICKTKKDKVKRSRMIIIDDVVTTGSTVLEASRVLLSAGAHDVQVVAIARTL